jgi:hypothetical protein
MEDTGNLIDLTTGKGANRVGTSGFVKEEELLAELTYANYDAKYEWFLHAIPRC